MSMPVLPAVCCIVVEITVKLLYGEDSVPTVNDPNYPGQKIKLYWDHFKRMFIAGARPVSQIKDFDIDKVEERFIKSCRKTYRDCLATVKAYKYRKLFGVLQDWIKAQLNIPEWMRIKK